MSKYKVATAVKFNIAITTMLAHVEALNDRIALKLETIGVGEYFDVYTDGVTIQVRKTEKGGEIGFGDGSWLGGLEFSTKLGSKAKPLNKRVLNDIQVWFHRAYSASLEKFKEDLDYHAADVTVRRAIDTIGIIDRLTGKSYECAEIARASMLNELVNIEVTCSRTLFNKVTVTVSVQSKADYSKVPTNRLPLLAILVPVASGMLKQFTCHYKHEPVNQYVQDVVKEYFDWRV